ncbi:MAG TPA: ATP-binding cassette domain-containing protein, partial [Alphaproteobacteria bacterium]|nr:ATP-binding cassette domain-containing protein [Alphaproteobacteria bacterium]
MASILLDRACVHFPIYSARSRSLRESLLRGRACGRLGLTPDDRGSVRALVDLSFNLGEGDRLGLVGRNGAGKTTLLRVLAGVYEPTSGGIRRQGSVASLFDLFLGMEPELTGYENILLRGALLGVPWREI